MRNLADTTKQMGNSSILFTALVSIKSASLHPLLALRLLMQVVKANPFHSFFAEEKLEHTPPVSIARHFATSIPITFYHFLLTEMYLTADT
jgi:hypothetical protein